MINEITLLKRLWTGKRLSIFLYKKSISGGGKYTETQKR